MAGWLTYGKEWQLKDVTDKESTDPGITNYGSKKKEEKKNRMGKFKEIRSYRVSGGSTSLSTAQYVRIG